MVCLSSLVLPTLVMAEGVTFRGTSFATIEIEDIDPNNWKERQPITVTLIDKDANRDPNVAEKLTLPTAYDFTLETKPNVDPNQMMWKKDGAIASLGSANSLRNISAITLENNLQNYVTNLGYRQDKNVAIVTTPDSVISLSSGNSLILSNAVDVPNITKYASEPNISHFINYDVRSLNQKLTGGKINSFSIMLEGNGNSVTLVESTSNFQNYFKISNEKIAEIKNKIITRSSNSANVKIIFENIATNAQYSPNSVLPIALDVFSFGVVGKGDQPSQYVINAVYRLELEETGTNTDTFTGTIGYERITAKNINTFDFSKLTTSGKNIVFPTFPNPSIENWARVTYFDRGADGVITQVGDQQELIGKAIIPPIQITTNEDVPITVPITTDDFWKVSNVLGGKFLEGEIKVTGTDDKITFIPAPDYFGTTELMIELSESYLPYRDLITQTKLQITVKPVNDTPTPTIPQIPANNTVNQTSSKNNLIKTCGVGTYLVNGVCKIRPDQIKTSIITLTSAEPKIVDSNNRPVSIIKANDNLFVNVGVENLGKQTEKFVGAYRYIQASTGKWSEWTWVSASVNAGKYTNISIPWKPSMKDSYAFDIQIWDNEQKKNKISSEKLTVNVMQADAKKVTEVKKVDEKKALADKKVSEAKKIADAKKAEKIKIAKEKAKERAEAKKVKK